MAILSEYCIIVITSFWRRVILYTKALLTDLYQLTMMQGLFFEGKHEQQCVFDRYYRSNPFKGGYTVVAGLEHLIDYVENIHFSDDDLAYLKGTGFFRQEFLDYLKELRFTGDIYAMPEEKIGQMVPELLITYGGHVVSKRLKKFLRQHPPKEHWHVSPDGEVVDLYGSLTTVIEMDPFEFLEKIASLLDNRTPDYPRVWENYCKIIPEPDFAYSEMLAVGTLLKALPESCALHLANSSVVRYAQLYSIPPTIEVCCNRGTSGIEGSLSTAVGYAAASDKLNFIAIGDLSFFYDMNALWNINVRSNLRILLLNNGGGEIFHTLPGLDMSGTSHKFIAAVHKTSAKGWAEERGFLYLQAQNDEELTEAMKTFTQPETMEQPVLLEVFTNKNKDARMLKNYYHQLKQK